MQIPPNVPPLQPLPRRLNPTAVLAALVLLLLVAALLIAPRLLNNNSITAVEPAIVNVTGQLSDGTQVAGTGMLITSNGFVLTNNHVIDGVHDIFVEVPSTKKTYGGTVVDGIATQDVAVVKLTDASNLPTVPIGDSDKVAIGDHVTAVGNALGFGGSPTVSESTINALNQTITAADETGANVETLNGMLEISGIVEPGDSGGPLIDTSGKVIGMDTAAKRGFSVFSGNNGYAIPINTAMSLARRIMTTGG
jgi:S1-C subfamily serine protease